jgi:ABC-2 type transport system ATP-binding protein
MAAIDVERIVKRFGDFTAVNDVTFGVEQGEIFGLLGPNGAGKSTLIRILTTLLPPTSGTARVGGFDIVARATDVRRTIGVIPQAMTSDLELTVRENLLIHAKLYGVRRDKRRRLIDELLEAVELTSWADTPVKKLSGGMRRRAEIARGLVHEPRIFFLDEPTTGLDPQSRRQLWGVLERFRAGGGTILITTHYMDEAHALCDRVGIMDHGRLIALGTPASLVSSLGAEHVIQFALSDGQPLPDDDELRVLPGVTAVHHEEGNVSLGTSELHRAVPALLDALRARQATLSLLTTHSATLEDVFVSLTGRHLRDG